MASEFGKQKRAPLADVREGAQNQEEREPVDGKTDPRSTGLHVKKGPLGWPRKAALWIGGSIRFRIRRRNRG